MQLFGFGFLAEIRKAGQLGQWKAFAVGLESDGLSMNNYFGFELIAETSQGLSNFKMVFEYVWFGLLDEDRKAIASKLKRIVWTDNAIGQASSEEIRFVSSRMKETLTQWLQLLES